MNEYGKRVCWGANRKWLELPITNLPPYTIRVRRRVRDLEVARAFVRLQDAVEEWCLCPDGEAVKLGILKSVNRTEWKP
jgi:hypothetical protein